MTKEQASEAAVGQVVMCNGFVGAIIEIHGGDMNGMVTVRLKRGTICLGLADIGLYPFELEKQGA